MDEDTGDKSDFDRIKGLVAEMLKFIVAKMSQPEIEKGDWK